MKLFHYETILENGKTKPIVVAVPESAEEEGKNSRKWDYNYGRSEVFWSQFFGVRMQTMRHHETWGEWNGRRYVDVGPRDVLEDFGDLASRTCGRCSWSGLPNNGKRPGWPKDELGHPVDYVVCSYPTKLKTETCI